MSHSDHDHRNSHDDSREQEHKGHGKGHRKSPITVFEQRAEHEGHTIIVKTQIAILIDGKPFPLDFHVIENNRIKSHAVPYTTFGSVLRLVKAVLETYPDALKVQEEN